MTVCTRCGAKGGVLFTHHALCADCNEERAVHQKELRDISIQNRELLAARLVHPAGKGPARRAREVWVSHEASHPHHGGDA